MKPAAFFRGRFALAMAALLLSGCTDSLSPTEPGLGVSTTPTPVPHGNIAGAWTGTYSQNDFNSCNISGLPAQANFEQDGPVVRGTFSTASDTCGLVPLTFTGTLNGNDLVGRTLAGGVETFGYVQGTLSGSTLEIGLGVNSFGYAGGGQLHFHR